MMTRLFRMLLFASCLLNTGCTQVPNLEVSRQFQQAEDLFAAAESPQQFQKVAALHQEILDSGFHSGVVHYNQGNAWLQAGQTGRAIAAYRQAQRQMPRDPYLAANLNHALSLAGHPEKQSVAVLDHLFFWQHSVSYREKLIGTTVLLTIVLTLAALLQRQHPQPVVRNLLRGVLVILSLLIASVTRDWSAVENTQNGVIVDEVVARKGGAGSYEPAFTQPLRDGTECVVISQNSSWYLVQLSRNATGWVPARSVVTY